MNDPSWLAELRMNIQPSMIKDKTTAGEAFRGVIARPPEPTPMEIWQEFISKPAQAHQEEAMAVGRDAYLQKADDMLTLGEQLIGPRARDMMPYVEQFAPPPEIAEMQIPGYSPLVDQALAEVENYDNGLPDQFAEPL